MDSELDYLNGLRKSIADRIEEIEGGKESQSKLANDPVGDSIKALGDLNPEERKAIEVRFWTKVKIHGSCWIWIGTVDGTTGYGKFYALRRNWMAHRFSYVIYNGPIAEGLVIDHLCRNRQCVNPEHLEAVNIKLNVLRGLGASAINARKLFCPKGHSLSGANLVVSKGGKRRCRICKNATWMARYRVKRESEIAFVASNPDLFKIGKDGRAIPLLDAIHAANGKLILGGMLYMTSEDGKFLSRKKVKA